MEGTEQQQQGPAVPSVIEDRVDKEEIEQFLLAMEEYIPTIPDDVTSYYLSRSGYVCADLRVQRVISLAAQKFISDIADSCMQYSEVRQYAAKKKDKKVILTMEDLTKSLEEYGIAIHKPPYYADNLTTGVKGKKPKTLGTKRKRAEAKV